MAEQQTKPIRRRDFLRMAGEGVKTTLIASALPTDFLRVSHSFFNEPYPAHSILAFGEENGVTIDQLAQQYGCTKDDLIKANSWLKNAPKINQNQIVAIPHYSRLPESRDIKFIYPGTGALLKQVSPEGHRSWRQGKLVDVEQKSGLVFFQQHGKEPELVGPHEIQIRDGRFADQIIEKDLGRGAMAVYIGTNEPVEILGPGRDEDNKDIFGKVKVKFLNSSTGGPILLDVAQLRGPEKIPQKWVPSNSREVPKDSVILEEVERAKKGVKFINDWYERLGIDIRVPEIDASKFIFLPEGNVQNQNVGGEVQLVLKWIVGSIPTVTGYTLAGQGFDGYINHAYMAQAAREKTLRMIGHEWLGHQTHQMFQENLGAYYANDRELFEALEHWTEFVAFESMKAYEFYDPETPNWHRDTKWAHSLMQRFDAKGLNGESIVMNYGVKADMVGLEKFYDNYYGQGSFREWQKNVFYGKKEKKKDASPKAELTDELSVQHACNLERNTSGMTHYHV